MVWSLLMGRRGRKNTIVGHGIKGRVFHMTERVSQYLDTLQARLGTESRSATIQKLVLDSMVETQKDLPDLPAPLLPPEAPPPTSHFWSQ